MFQTPTPCQTAGGDGSLGRVPMRSGQVGKIGTGFLPSAALKKKRGKNEISPQQVRKYRQCHQRYGGSNDDLYEPATVLLFLGLVFE